MDFPYGKAPLAILVIALTSGVSVWLSARSAEQSRPDLTFVTFTKEHAAAYKPAVEAFEKQHGVRVQIQVVNQQALQGRLQSALQVGADVPDMVELLDGTMGIFTKGPLEDVGFVDLTDRIHAEGLYERLVTSRFGKWSSRGRIFALPHDVHPVMLAYRRDLVEQMGIDVSTLTTWAEFARVGREIVTKDLTGNGIPDRYMIDLPYEGGDALRLLLLQAGGEMFTETGDVGFDSDVTVNVIDWYIRQTQGPDRIAFAAGWGQNLAKAMIDGLCIFYICPDWRTSQFEADVQGLSGKLALMPLPAWEDGGRRTSTWGGTGLAITKQCRDFELAWKLAMHLYFDEDELGPRFADTNILPPLISAWNEPEFFDSRPFFSGIQLGRAYAELAPQVPEEHSSPYMLLAVNKLSEAYTNARLYHARHGENGLREYTAAELRRCADRVREVMARNVFLADAPGDELVEGAAR
jgi:arabinosaccharide transport system substrate-binding protein